MKSRLLNSLLSRGPLSIFDRRGETLISTLLAVGMGGVVVGGTMKMLADNNQIASRIQDRNELQAIRLKLLTQVSCRDTLRNLNTGALNVNCTPTGAPGTAFPLLGRDASGTSAVRLDNTNIVGSGNFANSYNIQGDWWVRPVCIGTPGAGATRRIQINVAKRNPSNNTFAIDPLFRTNDSAQQNMRELNFSNPSINPLLGGQGGFTICDSFLNAGNLPRPQATCPASFIQKVNYDPEHLNFADHSEI